jgi:hypothetical protein
MSQVSTAGRKKIHQTPKTVQLVTRSQSEGQFTQYSKSCDILHQQDHIIARYHSFLDIRMLYLLCNLMFLATCVCVCVWTGLTICQLITCTVFSATHSIPISIIHNMVCYVHVCMYMGMYVCVYMYVHMCTHIHTHTHTHNLKNQ